MRVPRFSVLLSRAFDLGGISGTVLLDYPSGLTAVVRFLALLDPPCVFLKHLQLVAGANCQTAIHTDAEQLLA